MPFCRWNRDSVNGVSEKKLKHYFCIEKTPQYTSKLNYWLIYFLFHPILTSACLPHLNSISIPSNCSHPQSLLSSFPSLFYACFQRYFAHWHKRCHCTFVWALMNTEWCEPGQNSCVNILQPLRQWFCNSIANCRTHSKLIRPSLGHCCFRRTTGTHWTPFGR